MNVEVCPVGAKRTEKTVQGPKAREGVGGFLAISASVTQTIRTIPIDVASVFFILAGTKEVADETTAPGVARVEEGTAIAVRAGTTLDIGNRPDQRGRYYAEALIFADETVAAFQRLYPAVTARTWPEDAPWMRISVSKTLRRAFDHAAEGIRHPEISDEVARHRLIEVMLLLAECGVIWPAAAEVSFATRLRRTLAARPGAPWSAADVGRRLGMSEPTLRRRLAAEGVSFRKLLGETRLLHALLLLQTSSMDVHEIALASGYESPSRFAARFRERFGVSPSEMRGDKAAFEGAV